MNNTPNLKMPNIEAAQAQKHVTHNEALRLLDALVQLSVNDRDLTTAPLSPGDGACYIVAASATGTWAGKDQQIAAWQDNAWSYYVPQEGWLAWVADEDKLLAWDGTVWSEVSSGGGGGGGSTVLNPADGGLVGINATATTTNRLSVSSPATLFNHEGNGHQQKINKNTPGDTASQLYQSGFSGRAEIGLTGDDDFHFKVSPDGTSWYEAINIDRNSGMSSLMLPAVQVAKSTTQSIANATITTLTWDIENFDTDAIHDTVTNNSRLTARRAGKYVIFMNVIFSSNNTGGRQLLIRKNGATQLWSNFFANTLGGQDQLLTATIADLAANDYVEGQVWHSAGTPIDVTTFSIMTMYKAGV